MVRNDPAADLRFRRLAVLSLSYRSFTIFALGWFRKRGVAALGVGEVRGVSRCGKSRQSVVRFAFSLCAILGTLLVQPAAAQNLFEFLFGGAPKPQRQAQPPAVQQDSPIANFFSDPFGLNQQQTPSPRSASIGGSGPSFCVRTCDGKFFSLPRANTSPAQMCQAFCPATATRIYFGSTIEDAVSERGERYADGENAFAFRKALKSDCTCNGKSPAGLMPVDLSLDASLRPGDVVATGSGLLAYSGRGGAADFTPVASYPGLTSEVRTRLGEMKVSLPSDPQAESVPASPVPPAAPASRAKRAGIN